MKPTKFNQFLKWLETDVLQWAGPIAIFAATILVIAVAIPTAVDIYHSWREIEPKGRSQAGITLIQTIVTTIGGIAIFWNIVLSRKQLAASQEQRITDRFSKAVEQLGHDQLTVRVGAIYALGRIAQDSSRDNWTIMEVLSVFIREHRGLPLGERLATEPIKLARDVQAAMMVIGRRNIDFDLESEPLFLNYTDLRKISFSADNYCNIRFHCSDLREANLYGANFQRAKLWKACLAKAILFKTDLSEADLVKADFQEANMKECILKDADLQQANLTGAKGLTLEQVKSAKNWQEAIYDNSFAMQLGLKPNG